VVNISFAGIVSVLSGYNDRGLYLTHFSAAAYAPYRKTYKFPLEAESTVFDFHQVLESFSTTRQATRYLKGKVYGFSHNIFMADKKSIQVLEYAKGNSAKVRHWNSPTRADKAWGRELQIAFVDCHVLATLPDNCRNIKDVIRWDHLGELARFSPSQPVDTQDIANILFDTANNRYEIFSPQTLQSMMYLPASGRLYLYATPIDSTHPASPIHQVYLDLLPPEIRSQHEKTSFDIVWLVWLLLIVMLGTMLWMSRATIQSFVKR